MKTIVHSKSFADTLIPFLIAFAGISSINASDIWQPTAEEQEMLERINIARQAPQTEAVRLGLPVDSVRKFINKTEYLPPLAWNTELATAAYNQNKRMVKDQYFSHRMADGTPFTTFCRNAGYGSGVYQNLAAGPEFNSGSDTHNAFFIDKNVNGEPHRQNIIEVKAKEIGMSRGIASGYYSRVWTVNFGLDQSCPPTALGVVWRDLNGNGIYDAGEGLPDVTVDITGPDGLNSVQTFRHGGYQLPVSTAGEYVISFSGGGITEPIVKTVMIDNENVKVDAQVKMFDPSRASLNLADPAASRELMTQPANLGCVAPGGIVSQPPLFIPLGIALLLMIYRRSSRMSLRSCRISR